MSFGNNGGSYGGSAISDSIANYMNDTPDYGSIGNVVNDYIIDNGSSNGAIGDAINNYVNSDSYSSDGLSSILSSIGNGGGRSWFNTLGRLGTGILGALGDYDSSSNQQSYIPYTQWLGNGLAKFNVINNTANKQQQKNDAYGNTLMLSSLFGPGKSLLGSFGGQIGRNYGGGIYNDNWGDDGIYRNIEPRYTTGGIEWRDEKDVTI